MKRPTHARRARSARPPAAPDGTTEQRILDAAHSVFVRRGTAGARMQDIAREAAVNQALLHYYFRSKDRLSEAVFRRAATQFMPRVIAVMASDASLEQKVERVVALELEYLARAPYLPGYIISELTHHPDRARQLFAAIAGVASDDVRSKVVSTIRKQIDAQVRKGSMRAIAPEHFMVNLLSLCIFPFAARPMLFALLGFDQAKFDAFIDERRRQLAPFFLRALRP